MEPLGSIYSERLHLRLRLFHLMYSAIQCEWLLEDNGIHLLAMSQLQTQSLTVNRPLDGIHSEQLHLRLRLTL